MGSTIDFIGAQQRSELSGIIKGNNVPAFFSQTQSGGQELFVHMTDIGFPSFSYGPGMVDRFGKQPGFNHPLLGHIHGNKTYIDSEEMRISVGRELHWNPEVKSIVTSNGGPYNEVEVEVYGPERSNQPFWTVGMKLESDSGRQFIVTARGTSSSGYPTLTLRPVDNVADLIVASGEVDDLRINSKMVTMGRQQNMEPQENADFINRYINPTEMSFRLIGHEYVRKISGRTLQNEIKALNYYVVRRFEMPYENGSFYVNAYITESELQDKIRHMAEFNYNLIYGEGIKGADMTYLPGDGLVPQIPDDYKVTYTPKQFSYDYFSDLVSEIVLNNDMIAGELPMIMGTMAYKALQHAVQYDNQLKRYTREVPMSQEQAQQGEHIGNRIDSITFEHLDVTIKPYRFAELDRMHRSTRPHPETGRAGKRSGDFLLVDPSPVRNFDYEAKQLKDEPLHKIQAFCQVTENGTSTEMQDVWQTGMQDMMGNPINGPVINFNNQIEKRSLYRYGIALADKQAAIYGSIQ
jgi:hypothetical protein